MTTAPKIVVRNSGGIQSQNGPPAARDAKARKANVKIALLAQYGSRMCSTIDLSCPNAAGVWVTAGDGDKA